MQADTYYLSRDCFVCRAQRYWMILDVMRDRYLCVAGEHMQAIGHRLHGWQGDAAIAGPHRPEDDADQLIASLLAKNILSDDPRHGKPFSQVQVPAGERSIVCPRDAAPRPSPSSVVRFLVACTRIDWRLRRHPLHRTLQRLGARRGSLVARAIEPVAAHIAEFRTLRALYPRRYLCLFDSLALLEYLGMYGYRPRLVFGVVADPFEAHCWLQDGAVVLDDDLERVAKYTPILLL